MVPGELQSKFTVSEKPYIVHGAGYVMQTSKCIGLQVTMVKLF